MVESTWNGEVAKALLRLQKITSITEQLRTKERKMVFGLLRTITNVSQEVAPKNRQSALRHWEKAFKRG